MTLNARMSPHDPRLYNVSRDVAHNFGQVIQEVARRCEDGTWDTLQELLREKKVSDEEVGRCCQSLCRFIATQADDPKESMAGGMARCGFLDADPYARVVVAAYLGTVVLGYHWAGVREATINGKGPALHYRRLRWYGMRCAKLMVLPRWRRRLYHFWRRCRLAWRALWDSNSYEDT